MPSVNDLLNGALGLIGASPITAIDDGSTNANHCQRFYPPLRDGLMRAHHWKFAKTRVELAVDVTAPVFEFAYAYTLPPDCLKVIEYGGGNPDLTTSVGPWPGMPVLRWKIEGKKLLTNDGTVLIVYLRRIENPDLWDGLFYQLVMTHLASQLANAIPKDSKRAMALLSEAVDVIWPMATAVDGQEGSIEPLISDALTRGR